MDLAAASPPVGRVTVKSFNRCFFESALALAATNRPLPAIGHRSRLVPSCSIKSIWKSLPGHRPWLIYSCPAAQLLNNAARLWDHRLLTSSPVKSGIPSGGNHAVASLRGVLLHRDCPETRLGFRRNDQRPAHVTVCGGRPRFPPGLDRWG